MSRVTNLILNYSYASDSDSGVLEQIDIYLGEQGHSALKTLTQAPCDDDHWGGSKNPEVTLYAGAFNYLDLEAFLDQIRHFPWTYPDELQVLAQGQDDVRFRVFNLDSDSVWHELIA